MDVRRRSLLFALAGAPLATRALSACNRSHSPTEEVVVYTSVDQVFSEPIFRGFEAATGVRTRAVYDTEETKSTGVLNRLIAEAANPQADVFWSGDPVRPFQLVRRGLVEPYISPEAKAFPETSRASDGTWTGFAARARVLLVNKKRVPAGEMPRSIHDLLNARWRGQIAIANPLFGTTTIHVAALFSVWGEQRTRTFLGELRSNHVRIASSNGEVKRLVVASEVAFGLTDTDDAYDALGGGADVEVIYPDQDELGTLVIPTAVVLLKGTRHTAVGQKLIDYLLSPAVERQLAQRAAHMPLRAGVDAPPNVRGAHDLRAMAVDYARVSGQINAQEAWLRQWVGL